ncbi:MAG: hypothetical protein LUG51_01340, partial [Tannerellaceae bacterium]|nr:hypothetical protein [Tannerellaceae bacterium]
VYYKKSVREKKIPPHTAILFPAQPVVVSRRERYIPFRRVNNTFSAERDISLPAGNHNGL